MVPTSLLINVVAWSAMVAAMLLATPAFAQCTDNQGNEIAAEGESPDGQPCLICRDGTLEELPVRTVCGEDRFECRDDGVYREECTEQGDTIECAAGKPVTQLSGRVSLRGDRRRHVLPLLVRGRRRLP